MDPHQNYGCRSMQRGQKEADSVKPATLW